MLAFMLLSMAKFNTLSADAAASQELMKAFPATLQAVFGMTGLNLATITGYYGICFIFIAVMLATHAGMLGADIISKEETGKTAEFLYVKPITRARALTSKIAAGLIIIAGLAATTYGATIFSIRVAHSGAVPYTELRSFTLALLILQILFFALGIVMGTGPRKARRATAFTAGVVLTAYVAYVMQNLSPNYSWAKLLSPFAYFNAPDILRNGLEPAYVWLCAVLTMTALLFAYLRYPRRDIHI